MPDLFETSYINTMEIRNRFVRSATWEGLASPEGFVTPELLALIGALAKGGIGLIISSHAYVAADGQAGARQLGSYSDELLGSLRLMARSAHDEGASMVLQLAHAGIFSLTKATGKPAPAVSDVEGFTLHPISEMTDKYIRALPGIFGRAAERAAEAGFDGVQIHSAHGYLFSQFLSPVFNRRSDEFGGSLEHRARPLLETISEIRRRMGKNFPILVKLNSHDGLEGGLELEDSLGAAQLLESAGVDAIELSGGTVISGRLSPSRTGITAPEKEAYFRPAARIMKRGLCIPLILVGGIKSYGVAEDIIKSGSADYISMSRALICEPGLVNRWKSGDLRPAGCLHDNKCFAPALAGSGISCVTAKAKEE